MEELKKRFQFDVPIMGKDAMQFMADLIEKNEKGEIEIERLKGTVSVLKQYNNRSKYMIDAARVLLKEREEERLLSQAKQE